MRIYWCLDIRTTIKRFFFLEVLKLNNAPHPLPHFPLISIKYKDREGPNQYQKFLKLKDDRGEKLKLF